ncbi:MAG: shikimate kinase [Litorivicinus sp.]
MGSGKSTIGYRLAQSLDWAFCDTDKQIEIATGADIPWIFEKEGEAGFRRRERTALLAALSDPRTVLSTGGGVVELEENRQDLINSDAFVIYLKATVGELVRRVGSDPNRPLLQGGDPEQLLTRLLERRGPWYESVASFTAHTDRVSPKTLSERLLERIATL